MLARGGKFDLIYIGNMVKASTRIVSAVPIQDIDGKQEV